ncbi:hypothetical protein ACWGID_05495 [Kribbella sp. NPDC054772]
MDADKPREWADWVGVEEKLPWLKPEPYLLETADLEASLTVLGDLGFRIVSAQAPEKGDLERKLLIELSKCLGFTSLGAGSWAAFADRMWDLLTEAWSPPLAVVIQGFDRVLSTDLRAFVRCVHNLVSLTERVGLSDDRAQRQVVYFFVGNWPSTWQNTPGRSGLPHDGTDLL